MKSFKEGNNQYFLIDTFFNDFKNMQNGIFTLDWENVKSACVSTVLMAVIAGAMYIVGVGDVFAINVHSLVNILSMSLLTGVVSLLKNLLTTNDGRFLGTTQTN